jgi:hypothetical protein
MAAIDYDSSGYYVFDEFFDTFVVLLLLFFSSSTICARSIITAEQKLLKFDMKII